MTLANAWSESDIVLDESQCPVCQKDSCEDAAHVAQAQGETGPVDDQKLTFQPAAVVMAESPPVAIIGGVAYANRLTVLVSESGTGKTFVLLDAAASVSADLDWHGRSVTHGSVAYISFEGDAFGLRLRSLQDAGGHRLEHVHLLRASEPLSPNVDRDRVELPSRGELAVSDALERLATELTDARRPVIRLIVIDTVRASLTGSEDNSEPVSAYLRAVRRIVARVPGAAGVLAHHSGWQDGEAKRKRERGSSAFRGNCDATLYLEAGAYDPDAGEAPLTLRTLKARDEECPPPMHLIRRRVDLNEAGPDGQTRSSCIIARDRRTREDREAEHLQAVETEHRETDIKVLRAMQDYPAATSITRLRPYVGLRTGIVSDSVARILRANWATEGKRGQPYTITEAGHAQLDGEEP